jgi:hypothetical protein
MDQPVFAQELEALINRHSQENGSNTPDFILAAFLEACLSAWNQAVMRREEWYGRSTLPGRIATTTDGPQSEV